jgi:hypothetical protein
MGLAINKGKVQLQNMKLNWTDQRVVLGSLKKSLSDGSRYSTFVTSGRN